MEVFKSFAIQIQTIKLNEHSNKNVNEECNRSVYIFNVSKIKLK